MGGDTGLAETAGVTGKGWACRGDTRACGGWGSLRSGGWKRIAAGNRGKVFSSPTDVHVRGSCWQEAGRRTNSLEESPEQPHLRF